MAAHSSYDAVVVGGGPNGLAAAIVLARAGHATLLVEAREKVGGGARSAELTLPGFSHDVCSAIHPMAVLSPIFRSLPLESLGVRWIHPPLPLAHPVGEDAVALAVSLDETGEMLGADADAYRRLMDPLLADADQLFPELLAPLHVPAHLWPFMRFGLHALRSAQGLADTWFREPFARALLAGCAAHSFLPLDTPGSAAIGLVLLLAGHAVGWPCVERGSQALSDALAAHFVALGGEIETGRSVRSIGDLPKARALLLDVTPSQLDAICGDALSYSYRARLRTFRRGPGVFKVDWALDGPIPWKAEACRRAGTVHVGGTLEEIASTEAAVARGEHRDNPFVLVAQQSLFDPTRAPSGRHTGWAYCHVPRGSPLDRTAVIEAQIERFAPGFRDRILARSTMSPARFEAYNENYAGGDISGGANDLAQVFTRPVARIVPYATTTRGIYICSSSTPPGGGVHGLCGYWAARAALKDVFGQTI